LNAQGEVIITPAQINNNSTDNCGIRSYDLSKTRFFCNNVGINTVSLTVTDINGNTASANAIVNVREITPPVALCKAVTLYLDNSGNTTLNSSQVNNGSTDNCTIGSIVLDKTLFSCANIGLNTVRMTVTDVSGNSSFCTAMVNVLDTVRIKLTCPPDINQVITNTACNLNLTIPKPIVSDNCLQSVINSRNNTDDASGIYQVGITQIVWTATDKSGNIATCRQNISIKATPIANNDAAEVDQHSSVVINPVINDTDCENGIRPSSLVFAVPPRKGDVSEFNSATGAFRYTPKLNTYGKDSIQYTICDNDGLCSSAWIRINVKRINFRPVAVNDIYNTGNCRPFIFNVLANDSDPDGDPLKKPTIQSNVATGTLTQNADGSFTYEPAAGFTGTVSFNYSVCDNPVTPYPDPFLCAQATVTINVKQDTDCDAVYDEIDADDDNDGIPDSVEGTADTDKDGIPNLLDIDSDNDGIVDMIEAQPNGTIREPKWSDKDGDGLDDAFDSDNGGTPITALTLVDTDKDTVPDYLESDSDNDSLTDALEAWEMGTDGKADVVPANKDTDKDGLDDNFDSVNGWKVTNNPLDKKSYRRDFDNDGKPDWRDDDDDNDTKITKDELNKPKALYPWDYDADGVWDYLDVADSCDLLIPNGFSPDGDQFNQYFKIQCLHNYPNSRMQIYTRSGNLVYDNKNYGVNNEWWDGTSNHSWTVGNSKVPAGTYVYILIVGNGDIKKGTIYVNY
jgi:gliding motility-associated-like protein